LVEFDNFIVVVNQTPARLYSGDGVQYDPQVVRRNLKELFGTEGSWAPVSEMVRRLMEEDSRYPRPHSHTWTALIDIDTWCQAAPCWRGRQRAHPIVGCHGRDDYTKWRAIPEVLRAAYCADRACSVEILGGVAKALDIIGAIPANWTLRDFGSMEVRSFLSRLDFYVHFTHDDYIEDGARCVIEAMAAGVPVILPPVFREVFSDAAVYAEPTDVWLMIEALWADKAAYLARAQAGRNFVRVNCGWEQLPSRLERLSKQETATAKLAKAAEA
jgi:glycosyltransferase involved in cell wall biosynthesis